MVSLGARPAFGESMVAGDVVNTAARLQSAAAVNAIIVGEETYLETRDLFVYEPAAPVVAKGKAQPIQAWTAVHALTEAGERPRADWSMVGRASEIAILQALWERVSGERVPHLVSIFGSAGVGKSTLVAEFASIASERGARVIRGRSLPYRESGAYGALAAQLMQLCGIFESDPAHVIAEMLRARSAALLAGADADPDVVAGHLGTVVGIDAGNEAADRDVLFFSVRRFLEAIAHEQPTILVFEDIHWGNANMLDLIETMALRLRGLPLLLVTVSRPELLDVRESWGAGLAGYTALTLGPLDEEHAREIAVRRLGDVDGVDHVISIAEGNPLFIEQLAATMGETAAGTLPTSVRGIVAARLDALPRRERALLLDAAVVGKLFWPDALLAMNEGDSDLERVLEELERRELVRREPKSIIEGHRQFAFTHVLIRDVAYELLPRADRARRHALVAEFFERSAGASGEAMGALARHWRDAGENERAVQQLVRAAEQAERGWAKDHAALLYREALELVPESDTEQRSMVRRRLALASSAFFHVPDVKRGGNPRA